MKVGEKYKCSSTAVLNHAKKIGYDVNSNKNYKLQEKEKSDIISAYNSDKTSTELAEQYNVSRGMITKIWYDQNLRGKENNSGKNAALDLHGQKFGKIIMFCRLIVCLLVPNICLTKKKWAIEA